MDNLADERSLPGPTLWNNLTSAVAAWFGERLIGRPKHGAVTITFPNGKSRTFGRPGTGEHPHLTVHRFSMISETLRRGTVGQSLIRSTACAAVRAAPRIPVALPH